MTNASDEIARRLIRTAQFRYRSEELDRDLQELAAVTNNFTNIGPLTKRAVHVWCDYRCKDIPVSFLLRNRIPSRKFCDIFSATRVRRWLHIK